MSANKFKVGDKVKFISNYNEPDFCSPDKIYTIQSVQQDAYYLFDSNVPRGSVSPDGKYYWITYDEELTLIETKSIKTMSNIIEKIKLATKPEPEKSNIKAALRISNNEFTSEGKEAFLEFLYEIHKEEFRAKVADVLLAIEEDK